MNQQLRELKDKIIEANYEISFTKKQDIQLANVLIALNKLRNNGSYIISDAGIIAFFKAPGAMTHKLIDLYNLRWNLHNSLDDQSPETIDFLYNLICK